MHCISEAIPAYGSGRPGTAPVARLGIRQRDVLHLVCRGLRNSEIASLLRLKERTVKWYVSQLFLIFDVSNRAELGGMCSAEAGCDRPKGTALSDSDARGGEV